MNLKMEKKTMSGLTDLALVALPKDQRTHQGETNSESITNTKRNSQEENYQHEGVHPKSYSTNKHQQAYQTPLLNPKSY